MTDRSRATTGRSTISDIAALAKVSTATVSKAINGQPGVSEETRLRINAIAESLHWRPSARAVALTKRTSGAIGYLINRSPDILSSDLYFADLISGIERRLARENFWLLLQIDEFAGPDEEREAYVRLAREERVDGLILSETSAQDFRFGLVKELGLPAAIVSRPWTDPGIPWVGPATPGGGIVEAVGHLAELGHRKIAYVTGPENRSHVLYRNAAFMDAVAHVGLSVVGLRRTDFSAAAGAQATVSLLEQPQRPTAIVYDSDLMAIAACRTAAVRGLRVPQDLSVIGHDGLALGDWLTPSLTTIRQDVTLLGERCVEELLAQLGVVPPLTEEQRQFPDPVLVVRESTGPAPQ